jgi:hypothetical protein
LSRFKDPLLALKEPNMNNPRRQPGVRREKAFAALKELNIIIRENTSHPV